MQKVVVLGTGGTIAGLKDDPKDPNSYQAGQVSVADLVSSMTQGSPFSLESRQIAQIDSKDMDLAIWSQLLVAVEACMQEDGVIGVLITHGTDTMEETAYLLARLIKPSKPVVLTGAMKPFDAEQPDGPANMQEAMLVIQELTWAGTPCVCVVMHSVVHSPYMVQKLNLQSPTPFYSMPAPAQGARSQWRALGTLREQARQLAIEMGRSNSHTDSFNWGAAPALTAFTACQTLPRVEIVMSHSSMGEHNLLVTLLAEFKRLQLDSSNPSSALKGLVLVGPGAGNLHKSLYAALVELIKLGVLVVVTHRAPWGTGGRGIRLNVKPASFAPGDSSEDVSLELGVSSLSPVKARIALMLKLLS